MNTILSKDELVVKAFNNNIVLVNVNNTEKILFGRGIGFGKKPGSIIKKGTEIEKVFIIEDESNRKNLFEVIEQTNEEFFGICEEAIFEISKEIKSEFNESIHIGLIDHLFLALKRIKNNEEIENPFLIQIQTLYSREYYLAEKMVNILEREFNIIMPESEIGFIALHIHSAIANRKVSLTLKDNYLGNKIVEFVEERLGFSIDKKSLDYARFLTHIKFAIQRIVDNVSNNNELRDMIKFGFKDSYEVAIDAAKILEEELNVKVSEDEVTFLAIHIERFKNSKKLTV